MRAHISRHLKLTSPLQDITAHSAIARASSTLESVLEDASVPQGDLAALCTSSITLLAPYADRQSCRQSLIPPNSLRTSRGIPSDRRWRAALQRTALGDRMLGRCTAGQAGTSYLRRTHFRELGK